MPMTLILETPNIGYSPFNHMKSVFWHLFDEHGWGFFISWIEYFKSTHRPKCMAFRARRGRDGDECVTNWDEKAVSSNPDAALALGEVLEQLEELYDVTVTVGDPASAPRPGEVVSDAQMPSEQHLPYRSVADVVVLDGDGSRWVREDSPSHREHEQRCVHGGGPR